MRTYKDERALVADPRLNELAAGAASIQFDLDPTEFEHYQELFGLKNIHNVISNKLGTVFRARFFLGGKLRVLGIFTGGWKQGAAAAIYADCARLFFWPYRVHDVRPPLPADFNFSLERAQSLLHSHESLSSHLEAIRSHLAQFGDLREVSVTDEAQRKERKRLRESRRTVKAELRQLLTDQMAEIIISREAVEKLTQANTANYEQIKLAFHHILERLGGLEKSVDADRS